MTTLTSRKFNQDVAQAKRPAYLELAQRRQLPLATLDGELIRAAQAENVPLAGSPLRDRERWTATR